MNALRRRPRLVAKHLHHGLEGNSAQEECGGARGLLRQFARGRAPLALALYALMHIGVAFLREPATMRDVAHFEEALFASPPLPSIGADVGCAADEPSSTPASSEAPRLKSRHPECNATAGPKADADFLQRVRECGHYSGACSDLPVIEANVDYPGGGLGAVVPEQDYIVQFDIGLHGAVARHVLKRHLKEIDSCLHCPKFEETCLEVIVTGGAMWGDVGVPGVGSKAYDCMGGCGRGCEGSRLTQSRQDVGALDCLKHDVCSAWKTARTGRATRGFCHDPDCGDEAAQTLFNCWTGFRMLGSVGGNSEGPFSSPAACGVKTAGCWNHGGWLTKGRCKVFQGHDRGQGIPDPPLIRSPIQWL